MHSLVIVIATIAVPKFPISEFQSFWFFDSLCQIEGQTGRAGVELDRSDIDHMARPSGGRRKGRRLARVAAMGLPVACALTIAAAVLSLVPRFADATPDLQVVSMAESQALREEVRDAFVHTYDSYMRNAFPKDELLPLSCEGKDTLGSYALTLVDSLDTLAVLGNWTEFGKSAKVRKRESRYRRRHGVAR